MTLLSAAVLLFFVMDPLGNVPLFLSALRQVSPELTALERLMGMILAIVAVEIVMQGVGEYLGR